MIKLDKIISRINRHNKLNEAGIEKSYKAIMDLEKEILKMEKTFKREKVIWHEIEPRIWKRVLRI